MKQKKTKKTIIAFNNNNDKFLIKKQLVIELGLNFKILHLEVFVVKRYNL